MIKATGDYIIKGGSDGKSRLSVLSGVLQNATKTLLKTHGLADGATMLDVGCGGGHVALMAAGIIGDEGHVTGIDFDKDLIDLNTCEANDLGIENITYTPASAYEINFENEFDVVYSRFLLSHLTEPKRALNNMVRAVKPGGSIIIEDVQFSGHFCHPECLAFNRYIQLYTELAAKRGQNAEIGPGLPGLFKQASISQIGFDVIQPALSTGEGKWMAWITMDRIKEAIISQRLADATEVAGILAELDTFTKADDTIISLPRIFRVWGVKE